jgi:hypothetical protein
VQSCKSQLQGSEKAIMVPKTAAKQTNATVEIKSLQGVMPLPSG